MYLVMMSRPCSDLTTAYLFHLISASSSSFTSFERSSLTNISPYPCHPPTEVLSHYRVLFCTTLVSILKLNSLIVWFCKQNINQMLCEGRDFVYLSSFSQAIPQLVVNSMPACVNYKNKMRISWL